MPSTYIDFHVIQSLPPSNINRDDTGAPKSALYGGVRRARVSSQAWKRAARAQFPDQLDGSELGVRTKRLVEILAPLIAKKGGLDAAAAEVRAAAVLQALGLKLEKKARRKKDEAEGAPEDKPMSEYLVFLSAHQLDRLADLAVATKDGKIDKQAAIKAADTHGIDIALFGRMVADAADLNVDASVQVAHAISTHAVDNEFDYFTAVDDKKPDDETGAGMIGTVEFNSATLYRFATLNVGALTKTLGDVEAAGRAAAAFARGFVTSMPTGKQNTFGNRTVPDAVVVMVRTDQPVSLVGAFEDAVPNQGVDGYVRQSCERLADYARSIAVNFGIDPDAVWVTRGPSSASAVDALGEKVTLDELVARVRRTASRSVTLADREPAPASAN